MGTLTFGMYASSLQICQAKCMKRAEKKRPFDQLMSISSDDDNMCNLLSFPIQSTWNECTLKPGYSFLGKGGRVCCLIRKFLCIYVLVYSNSNVPGFFLKKLLWGPSTSIIRDFCYNLPSPTIF